MKHVNFCVGLLLAIGGAGAAYGQSGATAASSGAQMSAQSNAQTSVETKLTGKLDTKNAVVGQVITTKTTQSVRLADGAVLPLGTNLVGHVVQVQARQKGGAAALLAVTFDRAELKGGQTIPLRSLIWTVEPPIKADDIMAAAEAGSPTPAGASAPGGVRGTGGMYQPPDLPAKQANKSLLGTVTAETQGAGGQSAGSAGAASGEAVADLPRETGLPGVMLSNSASASESGTLTASGKNIALDSGTEITLVIAR